MYVLVIIGFDPDNRLEDAEGHPLCDDLILTLMGGSHGCSKCETGKLLVRTPEGLDFVQTNAAEVLVLAFESQDTASTWAHRYPSALGKLIYGYAPNYPAQSQT
jgi:hypothetical protein